MGWDEFSARLGAEIKRLGVSDRDARFLGFDSPDERIIELLSELPDGVGAEAFYAFLGANFRELQKPEAASTVNPADIRRLPNRFGSAARIGFVGSWFPNLGGDGS